MKRCGDLIDVIGCGNHETAVSKYHSVDVIALLIEQLSTENHQIQHGGYSGVISQTFAMKGGSSCKFQIRYHHGSGGAAPVTGGMIAFSRMSGWVRDADVIWRGHIHQRWAKENKEERIPNEGALMKRHPVWWIQTGSYSQQTEKNQLDDMGNYMGDYGTESCMAPEGTGGARIDLRIVKHNTAFVRSQVVME